MYRIGIDLGGTNIAAGVVNDAFEIVGRAKCKTAMPRPAGEIIRDMAKVARMAVENAGLALADIAYVGVGSPGTCNPDTGIIEYANNLQFDRVPLRDDLSALLDGKTVFIENDANAAALGEALAGAAKGAGMICPNMATMLSLVLCDAAVDPAVWRAMFRRAVDATFNRVTVDGDTSTNDTLIGLANGASGVRAEDDDLIVLEEALTGVLGDLAYMLVKDGEGATKVMHITVSGAATDADADAVARTVGHSQLVKTAMFGRDPNWGRIVAAAGRAGVAFRPEDLRVTLCGVELFRDGRPTDLDFDALLKEPLAGTDVALELILGTGPGSSKLLASDLSHAYVSLNADYRS